MTDSFETRVVVGGSTESTSYYFANNELIAKKDNSGTKTYFHNDHLGSTTLITNQGGTLVESSKYDPWGETKIGGVANKFQYTGQEKDSETGLNYYNFRYYDSHIRRFTQPDDIIQNIYSPQDLNRYSYVQNNPLKYTDPSGHNPILLIMLASGLIGAGMDMAEVAITNPNATWQDYAKAGATGFITSAPLGLVGMGSGAVAERVLAKTALSSSTRSIISNIVGGGTVGLAQNTVSNAMNNKPISNNFASSTIIGMTTSGIGTSVANRFVPIGPGRPATKLTFTIETSKLSVKNTEQLKQHTISEFISNTSKSAISTVANWFKPPPQKKTLIST